MQFLSLSRSLSLSLSLMYIPTILNPCICIYVYICVSLPRVLFLLYSVYYVLLSFHFCILLPLVMPRHLSAERPSKNPLKTGGFWSDI